MTLQAPELVELLHSGSPAPDGGGVIESPLARFSADVILLAEEEAPAEDEAAEAPPARTFRALAVPYDVPIYRPSWMNDTTHIQFQKGSVVFAENAQIFYGHDWMSDGVPIGRVTDVEETDAGPVITASISGTPKGDEIWTLMRDGVLNKVSVGVELSKWEVDEENALLTYTAAEAFETSVVPRPAFKEAGVIGLNSAQHRPAIKERDTMPTATAEALEASIAGLNGTVENLSRQVETIAALGGQAGGVAEPPFSSYGEFILAYAAADDTALAFARDLREFMRTGSEHTFATDTSDLGAWLKDSWIGDTVRHPGASRRLHNFFVSSALPATGMRVEYGVEVTPDGAPADVAEQSAENATLTYGEMKFDSETSPVKTYGGYTTKSRQEVERSSIAVVEMWFNRMTAMWARNSEAALRTATAAAAAHVLADTGVDDLTTADGWIDFIIDSAIYFDDSFGLAPEGIIVGYDVFKTLAKMKINTVSGEGYFLDRDSGRLDAPGLTGSVSGIQVIPVNSAGLVRVAHSQAIRTLESGNAPFQLTDDNITALSRDMSVYGYEAIAPESPELLVAPDVTA